MALGISSSTSGLFWKVIFYLLAVAVWLSVAISVIVRTRK
ncbi:UNVERIFIED_ORG: hypothetical protein M2328_004288 [Rhodococcus erythropolis]